jgi:hypothetical protein
MDAWYDKLVEIGESFGLPRDLIDTFEQQYDRRLEPLQALILTMHEAGLCSEEGDFGPEWQGISAHDMEAMDEDQ